jgi:hypothetical protein
MHIHAMQEIFGEESLRNLMVNGPLDYTHDVAKDDVCALLEGQ